MKTLFAIFILLPLMLSGCGTLISKRGTDIHWYGGFTPGDAQKLRQKLGPDTRRLIITSPGGVAEEFIDVAHIVQERGITVQVKDYCASACAFLFLAAKERVLPDDAFLAFHASPQDIAFSNLTREQAEQFFGSDAATNEYAVAMRKQLAAFRRDLREIFERAGVSADLYDKLILLERVAPGSMKMKPGSIKRDSSQEGETTHISARFEWTSCGRRGWIPDQDGLTGIGARLAQPYKRPPEEAIARKMHMKEKDLLFQRIDDLTEVACKTSSEAKNPSAQTEARRADHPPAER
ncbi:hypothetical protein VVD49_02430 [Uliginosibacterium sp. H3]|uniref:ATP-dependent Clp protease proteolytic subunit n=1 Tax=Uliginosibacterium silvisoli TaxID=3114758 RepID=A0ABU6JY24_9RHOO|nr:hypothetical protein [Uliginosibacterium sp. H3]